MHQQKLKRYNLCNDHWKQVSKLLPNYRQLSPYQFKDLLIQLIPSDDQLKIEQWLSNVTILRFTQERAALLSTVSQLEIEEEYWNHIATLITKPTVIWLSEIPKDVIKQNSINWDSTKTSLNIEQRRTMIKNQLQQAQHRLYNHRRPPHLSYLQMGSTISQDQAMNIILSALLHLVQDNLQYLRMNFEHKRIFLELDMNDAQMVKSFYDLNPTEDQVPIYNSSTFSNLILFHFSIVQGSYHSKDMAN